MPRPCGIAGVFLLPKVCSRNRLLSCWNEAFMPTPQQRGVQE